MPKEPFWKIDWSKLNVLVPEEEQNRYLNKIDGGAMYGDKMDPSQKTYAATAIAEDLQKRTYDSYFEVIETALSTYLTWNLGELYSYSDDPGELQYIAQQVASKIKKLPYASILDSETDGENKNNYSHKVLLNGYAVVLHNDKGATNPIIEQNIEQVYDPNFIWGFSLPSTLPVSTDKVYEVNIQNNNYDDDGDVIGDSTFVVKADIELELCIKIIS